MYVIHIGDDVARPVQLTKDRQTFTIDPGATVKTALVQDDTIVAQTTSSEAHADADWANSLIIAVFDDTDTAGLSEGPAILEVEVNDSGRRTWHANVKVLPGYIPNS
jgi:hypothetical protein